jgi:endonuclease-3
MKPTKASIRRLVNDLEAVYGQPPFIKRFAPIDELVSCILSQHTTDATSFPTFHRLRAIAPEWEDVVALGQDKLAEAIRPAGLPNQKSKSILGSLSEIKDRNGSYTLEPLGAMAMDDARDWLLSLPGVGPKTAAIVLCFAFGMPAIPVDTHIFRVAWRLGLIPKVIGEAKAHKILQSVVPEDIAFRFHAALIQHGRTICKAPTPLCARCPVRKRCDFYSK